MAAVACKASNARHRRIETVTLSGLYCDKRRAGLAKIAHPPDKGTETLITPALDTAAKPKAEAAHKAAPARTPDRADAMMALILANLDDAKAEDVTSIDLRGKTSLADMMVIATGRSDRHVGAIAERVVSALRDAGHGAPRIEGLPHCDWVLVDANDVIIHVFRPEVRQFYNLEKMWSGDRPAERSARAS
jgi:ribosome-associated protein